MRLLRAKGLGRANGYIINQDLKHPSRRRFAPLRANGLDRANGKNRRLLRASGLRGRTVRLSIKTLSTLRDDHFVVPQGERGNYATPQGERLNYEVPHSERVYGGCL